VELPAGATILTAEVSGEKVKPVQGADGDHVPLLRAGFRPVGAYTVSFVFLHSGAPFSKKGDSDISLPKMDVPINVLEWELFLPDRFKVKTFTGDAMSASLLPAEYEVYSDDQRGGARGGFQAGIGTGRGSGVGGTPINGRDVMSLSTLAPGVAPSQGQLGGYVFDPSGASIPNAHLQIKNLVTGTSWSAVSAADGSWRIIGLPSGTYQVTATAPGFQNTVLNIPYDAASPHAYRVGLNLGSVTSTVTVQASAVELNTESSQIWVKDRKHKKENLVAAPPPPPTASANVFNLQQRVAGVLPVAVDVPRAGTSYRFIRPLVVNEETKLNFTYKSK
jgi:hypothetical protein